MRTQFIGVLAIVAITTGAIAVNAWPVPGQPSKAAGSAESAHPERPPAQAKQAEEAPVLARIQVSDSPADLRQPVAAEVSADCPAAVLERDDRYEEMAMELSELRDDVALLELELELWRRDTPVTSPRWRMHPEATPWGAFVNSPDAELITNPETLEELQMYLEQVPVFLEQGEGTWLAERIEADDWFQFYGLEGGFETGLLLMVGPERAFKDIPHEKLRMLVMGEPYEAEWLATFREYEAED